MSLNIIKNYIDKTKKNKKEYNNDKKNVENVFPFFEQMRNYLIKKGKTHTIENLISAYLFQRAVKKQINFQNILSNTIQNSTPYLKLRMRK
jgi:ribosomal protein S7